MFLSRTHHMLLLPLQTFYGASEVCVLASSLSEVTASYSPTTAALMQYNDVRSSDTSNSYQLKDPVLSSNIILRYFAASVTNCFIGKDRPACQALANMCVLQKYHQGTSACLAFGTVSTQITTFQHEFTGDKAWRSTLPFLYRATTILATSASLIQQEVALSNVVTADNSKTGTLKFRLYKYAFNGTFLGWEPLGDQLQLCGGDTKLLSSYLRFGTKSEA
jgi:hypothetical protein